MLVSSDSTSWAWLTLQAHWLSEVWEPNPPWFRGAEWGEGRGEAATPSENGFKNYSLPSAYSAKGSPKNKTVEYLGKPSSVYPLQSPGGKHFVLASGSQQPPSH